VESEGKANLKDGNCREGKFKSLKVQGRQIEKVEIAGKAN
jgi:hypothetical protein